MPTEGQWGDGLHVLSGTSTFGKVIATCANAWVEIYPDRKDQPAANAALIAAAPDLLAACEGLTADGLHTADNSYRQHARRVALEAIAKARGGA